MRTKSLASVVADTCDADALPASRSVAVVRHRFGSASADSEMDAVAQETPVALVYNGLSHAVMMASPLDLEDFAIGFSLTEQIVDDVRQIYDIEINYEKNGLGIQLMLQIASSCFARLKTKRRQLSGKTGCGLCGIESLDAMSVELPRVRSSVTIQHAALQAVFTQLQQQQVVNALTGSLHAAGLADISGRLHLLREDVGRHNALDKLIGAKLSQSRTDDDSYLFVMTSRASYELVEKTARAGVSLLATISAPTSLAIDLAQRAGICLIGFVRDSGCVAYTCPERLLVG